MRTLLIVQDTTEILDRILERVKSVDPVNTRKWFDDLAAVSFDGGLLQVGCQEPS